MKTIKIFLLLSLFSCSLSLGTAQNYSDQFPTLHKIKISAEDYANAVQIQWDRDKAYSTIKAKYRKVQMGVDGMIISLENKVRTGKRIRNKDFDNYLPNILSDLDDLGKYYVKNSNKAGSTPAGNLVSLWEEIKKLVKEGADSFEEVEKWLQERKAKKTKERLELIKKTLYPYKLQDWDDVVGL